MNALPACILVTQDAELVLRLGGFLHLQAAVHHADSAKRAEALLQQTGLALVLFDLRHDAYRETLDVLLAEPHRCVVGVVGVPGSEPMMEAESLGVFECEDLAADRRRVQAMAKRGLTFLALRRENQELKDQSDVQASTPAPAAPEPQSLLVPLREFARASRHFQDMEKLHENIVAEVASACNVSRTGLFTFDNEGGVFRFRAGVRCLADTATIEYAKDDPLVGWMEANAHLICRIALDRVADQSDRTLMTQSLDALGAEIIMPLHALDRVVGWLFLGHRAAGYPFEPSDLEELMIVADYISTLIENAMLYEEATVQKTLAQTLLDAMPTGIVAIDGEGAVRCFNNAAQRILEIEDVEQVLHQPIEALRSKVAHILRSALVGEQEEEDPQEWIDLATGRQLSVQTRRLVDHDACHGAVAFLQDITYMRLLQEKQEELERSRFWTDLAASMSHEIRNPLVTIKTFSQLFPTHFLDEQFRDDFGRLVPNEVDRLNNIVEQINQFAHPPPLQFERLQVQRLIDRAGKQVRGRFEEMDVKVQLEAADGLPRVWGDESALTECFDHLLQNAYEAMEGVEEAKIELTLRVQNERGQPNAVVISISDNGRGIPAEDEEKLFSPFFTTKARGMGLGLPIVKRTALDHNGQVHVGSRDGHACVVLHLPIANTTDPDPDEAPADS